MNKLNPIIEALDDIDEKTAAAAYGKRKPKKPLKIVLIAAAAFAALGTTAAAATLGDHPLVKLNGTEVTPKFSSYVDKNGWTLKTTAIECPVDQAGYKPIGEVRAVYYPDAEAPNEENYYDELGIELDEISNLSLSVKGEKAGEVGFTFMSGTAFGNYHQSTTRNADGTEISIECWQDPIQAARDALDKARFERMSLDKKVELYISDGWDLGFPDYGGFEHPTLRELLPLCKCSSSGDKTVYEYDASPSEIMPKLYGYEPIALDGFIEKNGTQVVMYNNDIYVKNEGGGYQRTRADEPLITQQIFIYTLTDLESGKDVKFTVWRSAENKDTYTDHFDFDYENIPLRSGTNARLHQTADHRYVMEFENDGASYALISDDHAVLEKILAS